MKLKKLTARQRSILESNGMSPIGMNNWFYVKTETVSSDGNKSSSKNSDKIRYMIIQNGITEEIRKVEI